jgi:hypothetical protein
MAKKCIICENPARFKIKDVNQYYCEECAVMQFGDVALLHTLEEEAIALKQYLNKKESKEEEENLDDN